MGRLSKLFNLRFVLILILFLAAFLRLWQLDSIPSGIHEDEADIGYTAYSILKTGLSPYGTLNPFAIQEASGGSRAPLYIYTLIPLIYFFGLNIFIERLPSVFFGVATIIAIFFIVKKIFSEKAAVLVSLLLAINPWLIHISRQGLLEAIALFFVSSGIAFFLYASSNKYFYVLSGLFFGLSLFAYDAPKIFLPLFIPALIIYLIRKKISLQKRYFGIFIIVVGAFYLLMLKTVYFDGQIKDYNKVSVFNLTEIVNTVNRERHQTTAPLWVSKIFHNKLTVSLKKFQTSYFSMFSLNWFFLNGPGNLQLAVAKHGQFYLFEMPFFFLGIYYVFKKSKKTGFFLISWLFIGAVPGGLTAGNYAYRSVLLLPIPIIFSSLGILYFWNLLKKQSVFLRLSIGCVILIVSLVYVASYLFTYFFDYPVYASEWWSKQRNEAIVFSQSQKDKYENIYINGSWETMYAFRYLIDPKVFQLAYNNKLQYKNTSVFKLGNIYFGEFSPSLKKINTSASYFPKKSLFLTEATIFKKEKSVKDFYDPGGIRKIYRAIEVK